MTSAAMTPPAARSAASTSGPLDARSTPSLLAQSAAVIAGEHDFRAFSARTEPKPHYRLPHPRGALGSSGPTARDGAFTWRPTASCSTWSACWWAPWWTSRLVAGPADDMPRLAGAHRQQRHEPAGAAAGTVLRAAPHTPRSGSTRTQRRPGPRRRHEWSACRPAPAGARGLWPFRPRPRNAVTRNVRGVAGQAARPGIGRRSRGAPRIVTAAAQVSPSVVSMSVRRRRRRGTQSPFDFFFAPEGDGQLVQGFGTGFVVRADGVIITNQHVVDGADRITVTLADGTDVPATLRGRGRDHRHRRPQGGRAAACRWRPWARSDDLMIGEWVVALGNPYRFLLGNVGADGHRRRGERHRPQHPADRRPDRPLPRHDPDRRRDQPRQLRRPARQRPGRGGRRQRIDLLAAAAVRSGSASPSRSSAPCAWPTRSCGGAVRRAWIGLEVAGARRMRADPLARRRCASRPWPPAVRPRGPGCRRRRPGTGQRAHAAQLPRLGSGQARPRTWATPCWWTVQSGSAAPVRRRIRTGDLPSVTAEKVPVLQDLAAGHGDAGHPRGTPDCRRAGRAHLPASPPEAARRTGLQSGRRDPRRSTNSRCEDAAAGRCHASSVCGRRAASGCSSSATAVSASPTSRSPDDRRPLPLAARHALRLARDAGALGRVASHRPVAPPLARAGRGRAGARPRRSPTTALAAMRAHLDDVDLAVAAEYERRFRHDVMAHVHAFGDQAPAARPFIHLGATSAFVTDNADLMVMREGLRLLLGRLVALLGALRDVRRRACRHALPGLHALPAGAAHHGRQARHALDAGLRARRRGALSPDRDAAASAAARARPARRPPSSSCSTATTRRCASSTGGSRGKHGLRGDLRRVRARPTRARSTRRCSTC